MNFEPTCSQTVWGVINNVVTKFVMGLKRNARIDGTTKTIDDLTFSYNGNQMEKVTDSAQNYTGQDFHDGADSAEEYDYDFNGNMKKDLNKGITNIKYNEFNLPVWVEYTDGRIIEWFYTVNGAKLRKNVYDIDARKQLIYYKDYANGFNYENGFLDFFSQPEGRVKAMTDGSYDYHYDYKDHLGNTHVTYHANENHNAEIIQEDHYYPFGMRLAGMGTDANSDNKFLYNGKELEDDFNLNVYHYGARHYDPQLGKWW